MLFSLLSHVRFFFNPMDCSCQLPPSVGFPMQEYWSGLSFPPPGDLPNPGIQPVSPALPSRFFTTKPPGKPLIPDSSVISFQLFVDRFINFTDFSQRTNFWFHFILCLNFYFILFSKYVPLIFYNECEGFWNYNKMLILKPICD